MDSTELPDLGIALDNYDYPDRDEPMYVISNTDPLSMKKAFPVALGAYNFINREQLMAYVSDWMTGRREEAKKIASAKKYPSKNFKTPTNVNWTAWAPALSYAIAKRAADDESFREQLLETGEAPIGAAGNSTEWELGQDKSTAGRSEPPHHWGRNAWGRALTRLRRELREGSSPEQPAPSAVGELDDGLPAWLATPIGKGSKTTRGSTMGSMMIGTESVWLNLDARNEFLYNYRGAVGDKRAMEALELWVTTAPMNYADAHAFISTLPSFKPVHQATKQAENTAVLTTNTEDAYEKCKKCKKPVRVALEQLRGADEPPSPVARCYNTETCAEQQMVFDPKVGRRVQVIRPYTYIQRTDYREFVRGS